MSAQKIPLFGGMIIPVHNGNSTVIPPIPAIPTVIASPPDKALLPQGVQGTYEVHLWLKPGPNTDEEYTVTAYLDSDPATKIIVWSSPQSAIPTGPNGAPAKILDGYPIRGNVALQLTIDIPAEAVPDLYPVGTQIFGYYYRVGQGQQVQPERRFIGEPSPDGVTTGVPLLLAPDERRIVHVFENNRLDEISLSFAQPVTDPASGLVNIRFEDTNDNLIIPGQEINIVHVPFPNFLRDPQSTYYINQVPFGGGYIPNLDHIAITNEIDDQTALIHGYFTRR